MMRGYQNLRRQSVSIFKVIVLALVLTVPCESTKKDSTDGHKCLKTQIEKSDDEFSCRSEILDELTKQLDTFVLATAHRGDPLNNFKFALRDTHLNMRANYAKLIYSVGRNIYPLIVASDCENPELCGVGSNFKLYLKDGSMKRTSKVHDGFEIYKYLSHMVLGVFTIVSPYFKSGNSTSWVAPLREFQSIVHSAIDSIPPAKGRIAATDSQLAFRMLKIVNDYVQTAITEGKVEESTYSKFGKKLTPYMDQSMKLAAKLQIEHILPQLRAWKTELGDEWKNAYAVIPTVWAVSGTNVRLQMLEQVMDSTQLREQVFITEGARTEDDAITTLGRIMADRACAQLVFGGIDDDNAREHAFSLQTRRDVLSNHAATAIKEQCKKVSDKGFKCPMARKFASMTQ